MDLLLKIDLQKVIEEYIYIYIYKLELYENRQNWHFHCLKLIEDNLSKKIKDARIDLSANFLLTILLLSFSYTYALTCTTVALIHDSVF